MVLSHVNVKGGLVTPLFQVAYDLHDPNADM